MTGSNRRPLPDDPCPAPPGPANPPDHPSDHDLKRLVSNSYDRIADRFAAWAESVRQDERERYTSLLLDSLPPGSDVLDLGCGPGISTTRRFAERFTLTAVDISARNVEIARKAIPSARFIREDMTQLEFPLHSFDAVVAFYSMIHVPRSQQETMFGTIARWLRPGGLFVASFGTRGEEHDQGDDFHDVPMFWSSYDRDTYRTIVTAAGLDVIDATVEIAEEFGQPVPFLWIVARRTGAGTQIDPDA